MYLVDYVFQHRPNLVDARRISDDKLVYIKRVETGDQEQRIAAMLSSERLRSDPRNHSVHILDAFQDDKDEKISYIVMPFLRLMDNPPFETVGEVLDFADQILEVCSSLRLSSAVDSEYLGFSLHA